MTVHIRTSRVRQVVRLAGELREIGTGENGRRHLVSEMVRILCASAGGAVLDKGFQLDGTGGIAAITRVGMDPRYQEHLFGDRTERGLNPCLVEMIRQEPEEGVSSSRNDLIGSW